VKVNFVSHSSDKLGRQAIGILKEFGCRTTLLENGDKSPSSIDVIFFTHPKPNAIKSRHCCVAAYQLMNWIPLWANNSVFLIALRENQMGNFETMVLQVAKMYEDWFVAGRQGQPWTAPATGENSIAFLEWLAKAKEAIPQNGSWEITPALQKKKKEKPSRNNKRYRLRRRCDW